MTTAPEERQQRDLRPFQIFAPVPPMLAEAIGYSDFVGECKKYWNGTMQEQVTKESKGKEENHVDVSTRVGNHSRGNGACSTSSLPKGNVGHATA